MQAPITVSTFTGESVGPEVYRKAGSLEGLRWAGMATAVESEIVAPLSGLATRAQRSGQDQAPERPAPQSGPCQEDPDPLDVRFQEM
jgi:hypothetical protein